MKGPLRACGQGGSFPTFWIAQRASWKGWGGGWDDGEEQWDRKVCFLCLSGPRDICAHVLGWWAELVQTPISLKCSLIEKYVTSAHRLAQERLLHLAMPLEEDRSLGIQATISSQQRHFSLGPFISGVWFSILLKR